MKTTLSTYDIVEALIQDDNAGWSRQGALAIAEYMEQYEEDRETELELDVDAIHRDLSEHDSLLDWAIGYHTENQFDDEFGDVLLDPEELHGKIREYIQDRGQLIEFDDGIIVSSF